MKESIERFLNAMESIAASLGILAAVELETKTEEAPAKPEPEEKPKPRRKRRTKAQIEADKKAEAEAQTAEKVEAEVEATKAAKAKAKAKKAAKAKAPEAEVIEAEGEVEEFDYEILKQNVLILATSFGQDGRAATVSTLASFKVSKADQLPPEQWPDLNAAIVERIEEFEATAGDDEDDEDGFA